MSKLIHIPKVGHVEFPDGMDDKEIAEHASNAHTNARAEGITKFMQADPAIQGLPHSQRLKELSAIATLMEKYPRLADAVDKGIEAISQTGEQSNESPSQTAPDQQQEQSAQSGESD